jgi:multiple sugar transport system substrate-binding protein
MSAMHSSNRPFAPTLAVAILLFLGAVGVLLSGCDLPSTQPTAAPGKPTSAPTPSQPAVVPTEATDAIPLPAVVTLTVWTTDSFSPTQAITHGQILAQGVVDYEAAHPDVRLEFILRKPYGKGGILDYLLTTHAVVPDLMPDLAIIDMNELGTAVQAELLHPLDAFIPEDLIADLFPAVRVAGTFDGQLYALQFQADVEHLVYNTGKMTIPPRSWPGVLSNPGPYIFPAGGQAGLVNDASWIQVLAVQPQLPGAASEDLLLDEASLAAVLQYYQDGVSRGIFPAEILSYHTTDDCWEDYLSDQAALTHVSAHRYMVDRDRLQGSTPAPIPAIDGPAAAINKGWGLVLVTPDPARQLDAVEFMIQWLAPETNASWNQAVGYLPTRQAALALWDQEDSYVAFVQQQLLEMQPRPMVPNYTQVAAALQDAVESVLTGAASPEEAAAQVIDSVD